MKKSARIKPSQTFDIVSEEEGSVFQKFAKSTLKSNIEFDFVNRASIRLPRLREFIQGYICRSNAHQRFTRLQKRSS